MKDNGTAERECLKKGDCRHGMQLDTLPYLADVSRNSTPNTGTICWKNSRRQVWQGDECVSYL